MPAAMRPPGTHNCSRAQKGAGSIRGGEVRRGSELVYHGSVREGDAQARA